MPKPPLPAQKPNRLANASSPYLRQHQNNPVDWQQWSDAALQQAKQQDKPIFLSIGYAACHWCHVMAAESFADPEIAAVMNEHFVCIKVDREERPDLDEIYLTAVQAMGQQGGWPLSAWLTPDGRPFYGGTYFPPVDTMGRPGFRRVLEQLAKAWRERRAEVLTGADELTKHLQQALAPVAPPGEPTAELLAKVLPQSAARFDAEHGGFAPGPHHAPKFPSPLELQVLLRLGTEPALALVVPTLRAMRRGGIHDQLGGGFHRYATDRQWLVPHFEKMLYDNALLAPCYLEAAAKTGDATFAATARSTLEYLLREMRDPAGGFWSSQDAQSEGVEGKYFAWQQAEFATLLGDEAELLAAHLGVTAAGNWEHQNVLSLVQDAEALAKQRGGDAAAIDARLSKGKQLLLAARGKRIAPGTDDKVLVAWNGLVLRALATGYRHLHDERYRDAARASADFLLRTMLREGRVRRSYRAGEVHHAGLLEDHAGLADGLLALFEIDPDPRWLAAVRALLGTVRDHFRADDGGFWATADDHEALLAKSRVAWDAATPSGTALAVQSFLAGGLLLGDEALYELGVQGLRANHGLLADSPAAAPALVKALQFHLAGPREVVIAGEPDDPRTQALLAVAWRAFPGQHVTALVHAGNRDALAKLSPLFAGKTPVDGVPAAYVCQRGQCKLPITDPQLLGRSLGT
ncbi:MAG: thioredoxin domain-containing protein [Planctomycetota bacterium]